MELSLIAEMLKSVILTHHQNVSAVFFLLQLLFIVNLHSNDHILKWIKLCEKYHIPQAGVKEISELIEKNGGFYKEYMDTLTNILKNSYFAHFLLPFVICGNCGESFQTDSIFCPGCQKLLITSCASCNLKQKQVKKLVASECTIKCNHLDRVSSDKTNCFYLISPKAFILLIYEYSYDLFLPCILPSQIDDLVDYCSKSKAITPFTDMNTALLLECMGLNDLSERIKRLNAKNNKESNILSGIQLDNLDNTQEEKLFSIYCKDDNIVSYLAQQDQIESIHQGTTTKYDINKDISTLREQFNKLLQEIPIITIDDGKNLLKTDDSYHQYELILNKLEMFYCKNGYFNHFSSLLKQLENISWIISINKKKYNSKSYKALLDVSSSVSKRLDTSSSVLRLVGVTLCSREWKESLVTITDRIKIIIKELCENTDPIILSLLYNELDCYYHEYGNLTTTIKRITSSIREISSDNLLSFKNDCIKECDGNYRYITCNTWNKTYINDYINRFKKYLANERLDFSRYQNVPVFISSFSRDYLIEYFEDVGEMAIESTICIIYLSSRCRGSSSGSKKVIMFIFLFYIKI